MGIQCHREGLAVTAMAGSVTHPLKTLKAGVSLQIAEGIFVKLSSVKLCYTVVVVVVVYMTQGSVNCCYRLC